MNASVAAVSPIHRPEDRHRPLVSSGRLRLDAAACLPERFPDQACGRCIAACPLALLEANGGAPRLVDQVRQCDDACIGCGQCAAVCPSGALHVDGFAVPFEIPGEAELLIDCWRVPAAESPTGALRVPCLGGLTTGWLLSLFDEAGERAIRLLDRGQCADCPAGAGSGMLLAAISEARLLLFECGVDILRMPMLVGRACGAPLLPAIPERNAETPIARRAFFRALLGESVRVVEAATPSRGAGPAILRSPVQPLPRLRLVAALASIARRHQRPVPRRALPRLSLASCEAHGVCAAVCPTGALHKRPPAGGRSELGFAALRCIACAQCVRACPEQALSLDAAGGSADDEVLRTWRQIECTRCGADFAQPAAGPDGKTALCSACRKTETFSLGVAAFLRAPVSSDVSQP